MLAKVVLYLATVAVAIALIPGGAHVAALPNKLLLDAGRYFVVMQIYRGWALFGIVEAAAVLLSGGAAYLLRAEPAATLLASAACILLVVALLVFFGFVFPGNQATRDWTVVPDNWQALRTSWEWGHVGHAALMFLAFLALLGAAFVRTPAAN